MNTIIKTTNEQVLETGNTYGAEPLIVQPYINENKELVYPIKEIVEDEEVIVVYKANGTVDGVSAVKPKKQVYLRVTQTDDEVFVVNSASANFELAAGAIDVTANYTAVGITTLLSANGYLANPVNVQITQRLDDSIGLLNGIFSIGAEVNLGGHIVINCFKTTFSVDSLGNARAAYGLNDTYIVVTLAD